jgi:hypothetical protein
MGRMIGVVASDYEGVKEVARCEKGDRGDTWRKTTGGRGEDER